MLLVRVFERINRLGTTVLIATHDVAFARQFTHRRYHLERGVLSIGQSRRRRVDDQGLSPAPAIAARPAAAPRCVRPLPAMDHRADGLSRGARRDRADLAGRHARRVESVLASTWTLQLPADASAARIELTLGALRQTKASFRPVRWTGRDRQAARALARHSVPIDTLPLPRLIDMQVDPTRRSICRHCTTARRSRSRRPARK